MDAGDWHALSLLGLVLGAIGFTAWFRDGYFYPRFALIGGLTGSVLFLAILILTTHSCGSGKPVPHAMVASLLLVVLGGWAPGIARRAGVGVALFGIALGFQYTVLVHQPGFTGNPAMRGDTCESRNRSELAHYAWTLREDGKLAEHFPAGPAADVLPGFASVQLDARIVVMKWHSWFTWLYETETFRQDHWFVGGPFKRRSLRSLEAPAARGG